MEAAALERSIWLSKEPRDVFPFFADAANLQLLTPPWLHFEILTPLPIRMEESTEIEYRLRLRGLPFEWRSQITEWRPPKRFVDVQRRGPYRRWEHEHVFEPRDGGTLMRDRVCYVAPGGAVVDRLFVRPELKRIFDYREEQMLRRFNRRPIPRRSSSEGR